MENSGITKEVVLTRGGRGPWKCTPDRISRACAGRRERWREELVGL